MSHHKNPTIITEQRKETMVVSISTNNTKKSNKKRLAHFLKPTLHPTNQPLPNPPSFPPSSNKPLKKMVSFKGRLPPQKNWDTWVHNLQQTHQKTWQKAGIFNAIKASTYTIKRDNDLILKLAQNWCPLTNTFIFPWGECSITLEDVMILGGFPILGDFVKTPFENMEFVELGNEVIKLFTINRKKKGPFGHYDWMEFFMGFGGEVEHRGFLILWLSRHVFSTNYYSKISHGVVPIAIALSFGTRIALGDAVLGSIYRDLSLLQERFHGLIDGCSSKKLVLWAPFQLVQVWAWERFPMLGPSPGSLLSGEPRLARWDGLDKVENDCFLVDFKSLSGDFVWRPYALFVENWQFPKFYGGEKRFVLIDSGVGDEIMSFAKCLQACELVGLDCSEKYLPYRVGMQFGMDQDIPGSMPRFDDVPMEGVKLHLPPRSFQGGVTARYCDWFRNALCSENNHPRRVRSKLTKNSSPSMKNIMSSPTDLTSLFDVPVASYHGHGSGVGKHVEFTACFDKNSVPNDTEMLNNSDGSTVKEIAAKEADGKTGAVAYYTRRCSNPSMSSMRRFRKPIKSCDISVRRLSLQCNDNNCDGILTQRVVNEAELTESEMEKEADIDENLTCTRTDNSEKIVQGAYQCQEELLRAVNGEDKEESQNNRLGHSASNDNNCDAILTQRVVNEAELAAPEMEKHANSDENLTCTTIDNSEKVVQGAYECQDEILRAVKKGKDKEESQHKSLGDSATNDNNCDAILTQRVVNEAELAAPKMEEDANSDENLTCTRTGNCEKVVQGAYECQDEIPEAVNRGKDKEELQHKRLGDSATNDVHEMAVECENLKLGNGSYSDPICCDEDEDDDDDIDFDLDKMFGFSEIKARICNLEREVSSMQVANVRLFKHK